MIRIYRDDEYALKLEFNFLGATRLKEMFTTALKESNDVIHLKDSFIEFEKPIQEFLVTNQGDPSELSYVDGKFILELDIEIIEFCIDRFNDCINKKDFFPSEICDVDFENDELTLYGMFIE